MPGYSSGPHRRVQNFTEVSLRYRISGMVDDWIIAYLRYAHGGFNLCMMCLFLYQGMLGLRVRRGRKAGSPPASSVRLHRRFGPVFMTLGVAGFLAGLTLVYLDKGRVIEYPLHFATGFTIAVLLLSTFAVSRKIRGPGAQWRDVHYILGIVILFLYPVQVLLGLGILL